MLFSWTQWTARLSFLAFVSKMVSRQLDVSPDDTRRVATNLQVVPQVSVDSPEALALHNYLFRALWLQNKFAKGAQKHFDQIPEVSFRLGDSIYKTVKQETSLTYPDITMYVSSML